jgi:protein translocase SecG subunit|tara:strand:- start:385 stop:600 length:216 start_codon:yes stop_codon:yes gene_type:complete
MLEIIWIFLCLILIALILLRVPSKDGGSQNFAVSGSLLGSPKATDNKLQIFLWVLIILFLSLSGLSSLTVI